MPTPPPCPPPRPGPPSASGRTATARHRKYTTANNNNAGNSREKSALPDDRIPVIRGIHIKNNLPGAVSYDSTNTSTNSASIATKSATASGHILPQSELRLCFRSQAPASRKNPARSSHQLVRNASWSVLHSVFIRSRACAICGPGIGNPSGQDGHPGVKAGSGRAAELICR